MYKNAFFATLAVATKTLNPAPQIGFPHDQVNKSIAFSQVEGEGQETFDCTCECDIHDIACWNGCYNCLYFDFGEAIDCTCECDPSDLACWEGCFDCLHLQFGDLNMGEQEVIEEGDEEGEEIVEEEEEEEETLGTWIRYEGKDMWRQGEVASLLKSNFEDLDAIKAYIVEQGWNAFTEAEGWREVYVKSFDYTPTEANMGNCPAQGCNFWVYDPSI